jgi:hypothetical protein
MTSNGEFGGCLFARRFALRKSGRTRSIWAASGGLRDKTYPAYLALLCMGLGGVHQRHTAKELKAEL